MSSAATERRVNTGVVGDQDWAQTTGLIDGGWIVTWSSATEGDADSADVYQQRYDRNGRAIGSEERINTTTGGAQTRNFVTPLSDGGWLATWLDDGQFYQQRYGSDGAREGSATPVTSGGTYFASSTVQLLDGGWVAASGTSLATGDVYQTRYNGSGSQVGATVLVSEAGWSMFPSTTALQDGGWVVTWTQDVDTIWQQRYDASGNAFGSVQINSTPAESIGDSPIVTLADGGWVVAWSATNGDVEEIRLQRFAADGSRSGGETTVTTDGMFADISALKGHAIAALADGGWIVTWVLGRADTIDSGEGQVLFQRFDSSGNAVGSAVDVSSYPTIETSYPSVAALADGGWLISWTNTGADGDGDGIYQARYTSDGIAVVGELPSSADQIRTIDEDSFYTFDPADFAFIDGENGTVDQIVVTSVPANGQLWLAGSRVEGPFSASAVDLGSLIWFPEGDSFGDSLARLTFRVKDADGGVSLDDYEIDFNVTDVVDLFKGTAGKDKLTGTDGDDVIRGLKGNDVLIGRGGADYFVIEKRSGKDKIKDFDAFDDGEIVDLSKVDSVRNWNDLRKNHLDEKGGDAMLDLGGGNIVILKNVDVSDLDRADFLI